jgi:hypothetical protein
MRDSLRQSAFIFGNNERPPQDTDSAMIFRSKEKKATPTTVNVRQHSHETGMSLVSLDQEDQAVDGAPGKQGKPKILLLDLDTGVVNTVQSKWADVVVETLGRPYKVPKASGYSPVINHDFLSGHKECDVIVAC